MFKIKIGSTVVDNEAEDGKPTTWQAISWIVFYILCFAYCARAEIVEIMQ